MTACDYCGTVTPQPHREHMVPRSLGGSDHPSNIATACQRCNSRKGTRVGRWLPCGRASWRDYCIDSSCEACAPHQLHYEMRLRALSNAGQAVNTWTATRDDLIRRAVHGGAPLRQVGEAVGLSHTAVKFIAHGRPGKTA